MMFGVFLLFLLLYLKYNLYSLPLLPILETSYMLAGSYSVRALQDRYSILREKYDEKNLKDNEDTGQERGISLEKSLSAALDSFDNLFCRRCLV